MTFFVKVNIIKEIYINSKIIINYDYKVIYLHSNNLIKLWLISDWLEKWSIIYIKKIHYALILNNYKTMYLHPGNLIEL